jgi:hypothetical protein
MEITFRRITGKYGFRFDALAVKLMCEQYDIDLNQIDQIPRHESVAAWVYNAHRSWSMYHYRKPKLSFKKTQKFIDRMQKRDWDKMVEVMRESQGNQEGDDSKKKKQHGTASTSMDGKQEEQNPKS